MQHDRPRCINLQIWYVIVFHIGKGSSSIANHRPRDVERMKTRYKKRSWRIAWDTTKIQNALKTRLKSIVEQMTVKTSRTLQTEYRPGKERCNICSNMYKYMLTYLCNIICWHMVEHMLTYTRQLNKASPERAADRRTRSGNVLW